MKRWSALALVLSLLTAAPAVALDAVVVKRRAVLKDFQFENGERVPELALGVETYGRLNQAGDNAILICHFLAGDSHAAGYYTPAREREGWWNELIGPGQAIDTDRFFVVCMDLPCNMKATKDPYVIASGPSALDPATGQAYGMRWPTTTVRDMVHSQRAVLDTLGVRHLVAVTGPSLGGMLAWQFGIEYPGYADVVIPVSAPVAFKSEELFGFETSAIAIRSDPFWALGDYYATPWEPDYGVAMASYGLAALQSPLTAWGFYVNLYTYLRQAKEQYDANHYLYLIEAHRSYELGRELGGLAAAFAQVRADVLVIGYQADQFITPDRLRTAGDALDRAGVRNAVVILQGTHDHLSVLYDAAEMIPVFREILRGR